MEPASGVNVRRQFPGDANEVDKDNLGGIFSLMGIASGQPQRGGINHVHMALHQRLKRGVVWEGGSRYVAPA